MPGSDKQGGSSTAMPATPSTRLRGGASTFAPGGMGSLSSPSRSSPATSTTSTSEEDEPTSGSFKGTSVSLKQQKEMMRQKKRSAVKVLVALFPRIPKVTTVLLEFFIMRENKVSLKRDPLSHFCQEQSVLAAQDCLQKLHRLFITYQDIRDMVENLMGLHTLCMRRAPVTARSLGLVIRKLTIIVGELAISLEKISEVPVTDWMAVGDSVVTRTDRMMIEEQPPFTEFIPRTRDLEAVKLLGAGGFGAVYKARYKPANLICTVKVIASGRFKQPKQACIDKVVASVVRSPFLVKYYACFATKEAYVTMMEYVRGVDLMRVMERAMFLPLDQVRIIMAQLILAVEHMHLKGFLHRDIKVSNMLIIPGGRVKLIDFDTNKICLAHFTKRVMRGYFQRTASEFRDGESAGTIPYMAPEILKQRPYGRACDWWSTGVVFYKLMTGRVPFRGPTKKLLRDRIIASPLKWPKFGEHPHSANSTAKDMVYLLLKKNPVERLGSRQYRRIKSHFFFDDFDWNRLRSSNDLCDVPTIYELMHTSPASDAPTAVAEHSTLNLSAAAKTSAQERKLIKIEELTDLDSSQQKPLFSYASSGFKRLASMTRDSENPVTLNESFMDQSNVSSSEIDYHKTTEAESMYGFTGFSKTDTSARSKRVSEKLNLILFRKKSFGRFWSFGVNLEVATGEGGRNFFIVEVGLKEREARQPCSAVPDSGRRRGGRRQRHQGCRTAPQNCTKYDELLRRPTCRHSALVQSVQNYKHRAGHEQHPSVLRPTDAHPVSIASRMPQGCVVRFQNVRGENVGPAAKRLHPSAYCAARQGRACADPGPEPVSRGRADPRGLHAGGQHEPLGSAPAPGQGALRDPRHRRAHLTTATQAARTLAPARDSHVRRQHRRTQQRGRRRQRLTLVSEDKRERAFSDDERYAPWPSSFVFFWSLKKKRDPAYYSACTVESSHRILPLPLPPPFAAFELFLQGGVLLTRSYT
ncbi:microtubule-associated serine/threonine-protein kinase 3-like isoform X1 [Dermacentor albipictus]|uniref:microtubule-associated serine/threonine-protein kinase 3-like isoform X1 n=1 Tax=Dermacentor albipictus TaxID=60249 RepID=UPI0031FD75F6